MIGLPKRGWPLYIKPRKRLKLYSFLVPACPGWGLGKTIFGVGLTGDHKTGAFQPGYEVGFYFGWFLW